jgi:hypothetical protein
MNSNSNESKEKRVLRSFNSENEFLVCFVNQTTRNVHLISIHFKGEEVLKLELKYAQTWELLLKYKFLLILF